MIYAEYTDFVALYGEDVSETVFNRLAYDASALVDYYVTTVDGVNKLKYFFPEDTDDAEAIKRCVCSLVYSLYEIGQIQAASGVIQREDGTVTGKTVTSISSGSESMSFSSGGSSSVIVEAAKSESAKNALIIDTVFRYLGGHRDANGVNLLFVGVYPYVQQNNNAL